jgi:hypothetical protein
MCGIIYSDFSTYLDGSTCYNIYISVFTMPYLSLILPTAFVVIGAAVIIGFAIGRKSADYVNDMDGPSIPASASRLAKLLPMARQALFRRTEKRKNTILEMLKGEARHMKRLTQCNIDPTAQGLTSDDVSLLLSVSRNTARNYLNELEEENKILQVGVAGRGVHYVLKGQKA